VTFFQVKKNQEKLSKICATAQDHFERKVPLIIKAPKSAIEFIDDLLWNHPKDSFLPHAKHQEDPSSLIIITDTDERTNQATAIFNLTPYALLHDKVTTLYEFEDSSITEKLKASKERYQAYRQAGCHIITI
jgi:DNA polymerase-3 subunit chi